MAHAMAMAPQLFLNLEEKARQQINQQGLGKPIISARGSNGYQIVIVNNRIYGANGWNTFHDFLRSHMAELLGQEWGNSELNKPVEERHPILVWFQKIIEQQQLLCKLPGQNLNTPSTGAVAAYLYLAYDLYALDHNAELQNKLINRLKHQEQFLGARYEVQVAAMMARAGFSLEFEDEDDRTSRHCEFTATYLLTGKKFSVEVKKNAGKVDKSTHHISQALLKKANHDRIVFVDLNMPNEPSTDKIPQFIKSAIQKLRNFETYQPHAKTLPSAYIFLTNTPWEHYLDRTDWQCHISREGFKLKEFQRDHEFSSLQDEINAWEKHKEMHKLLKSIQVHTNVPITFGDESPPLAFGNPEARPAIGKKYTVKGLNGEDTEGILVSVDVVEAEKVAVCQITTIANQKIAIRALLSDSEFLMWKKIPGTYFKENVSLDTVETGAEMYSYYMEKNISMQKTRLLDLIETDKHMQNLADLDQPELLKLYSKQETAQAILEMGPAPKINLRVHQGRELRQ